MKQNLDYGYDVQKLYLEIMLADAETFARCQSIFDHTLFDKKLQLSAEFINEYVRAHATLPTVDIINATTKNDFKQLEGLEEGHLDWLLNEFETFTRHKSLERAILNSADLLEKGEYGPVEDMIKKAVQIGLTKDIGTNYFANPRERLLKIRDRNGQISTGWRTLDYPLFGGVNRGELSIFTAGSGVGKSLFLTNLGVNWALAGLNVIYLSLELSEEMVSMRIDSMITGIPSREVFKNIDDIEMKVIMIGKKSGSLQIKYIPSGKTVNDIRSYIKEYEVRTSKKVDVLLVDYLDLLHPINEKVSTSDLFAKDKHVSEELRNLSMEMNCILITASQLNRCLSLDTIVEVNGNQIQIKDVQIGDYVRSNEGPVKVLEILPITKQAIFEITTKSGKKIKCSAKHKFPTQNGIKALDSGLKIGDKLQVLSSSNK